MPQMNPGLTRTLLALTFVTGIVDAVSFLALGQVFAAMQTGNVIFLGLGLGGSAGAPVAAPAIALGAFVAGGAIAALLGRRLAAGSGSAAGRVPGSGLGPALSIEVGLLAAAAVVAAAVEIDAGAASAYALIALLSLTMGLRNTVVRGLGGPNLVTTVLNLTLTAVAVPAALALGSGEDLGQRAAAFAAILAGAVSGALLLKTSVTLTLAGAAAVVLCVALAQLRERPLPA